MKADKFAAAVVLPLCLAMSSGAIAAKDRAERIARIIGIDRVQVGADNNNADNPFVQPQDDAQAGGGRDQTLQFGDVLFGTRKDDLQEGRLGADVLIGGRGDDVQVGGLEHFASAVNNNDRAFGGPGDDIFLWKPGDASDFFDGGSHHDVVAFGLVAEPDAHGDPEFALVNDGKAGVLFTDPLTGLPLIDLSGSPGFCEVLDASSSPEAAEELKALDLDHLVRFFIRAEADDGAEDGDNGLRVTLHLRNVEFLACTVREGGAPELLDLRYSPPRPIGLRQVPSIKLRFRLNEMIL